MEPVNASQKQSHRKTEAKSERDSKNARESGTVRSKAEEGKDGLLKVRLGDFVFYRKGDAIYPAQVTEYRKDSAEVTLLISNSHTPVKPYFVEKCVKPGIDAGMYWANLEEMEVAVKLDSAN